MLQFLLTISDESNHSKIEYIYTSYYESMMKYAICKFQSSGRTNCQYDAEDAVQNAFVRIVKYIDKIDISHGKKEIKGYCFSILINEICNILGDKTEKCEVIEEFSVENEYNFIEELELRENYDKLVKSIENLDEKYSTTLYLVFCKEMTVNEIADMMGISAKTVYTRLSRGKRLLLDYLKGVKSNG